jgi:hypothetical protein
VDFSGAFALSDWLMLLSQHSMALRLLFPLLFPSFPADSAGSQQLDRTDRNRTDCSIPNKIFPSTSDSTNPLKDSCGLECAGFSRHLITGQLLELIQISQPHPSRRVIPAPKNARHQANEKSLPLEGTPGCTMSQYEEPH